MLNVSTECLFMDLVDAIRPVNETVVVKVRQSPSQLKYNVLLFSSVTEWFGRDAH